MDHKQQVEKWVDARLAALNPTGEWKPNTEQARARLRESTLRHRKSGRRAWLLAFAATAAGFVLLMVLAAPQACAKPGGCAQGFWHTVFSKPVTPAPVYQPPSTPAPAPAVEPATPEAAKPHPSSAVPRSKDYKSSGSVTAPLTCEIYTDYECPHCAALYRDLVPLLRTQYVLTGKVRLVHRDFPLTQHAYSRLAARYANAAGELGYYDAVVNQIFRTQAVWSGDGNVASQVAAVLPKGVMARVQELVNSDPRIDEGIEADMTMGREDQLRQTPTIVIVANGKRQSISGVPDFSMLQGYLDQLLKR